MYFINIKEILVCIPFVLFFQTLRMAWTFDDLLYAAYDPIFVLERKFFLFFCRGRRSPVRVRVARHILGEQCRTRLGHETVRQVCYV